MSKKYSIEDVFAQVYHVFFVKNAPPSVGAYSACLYNHEPNGFGCAIGCFVSNETGKELDAVESGSAFRDLLNNNPERKIVNKLHRFLARFQAPRQLFYDLQEWHDLGSHNGQLNRSALITLMFKYKVNPEIVIASAKAWELITVL